MASQVHAERGTIVARSLTKATRLDSEVKADHGRARALSSQRQSLGLLDACIS